MQPTEQLKEEHRVIERMLKVLDAISNRIDRGESIPSDVLENVVDFIRTFADKCHHGKEEDLLFARAEERGVPREGGPIGVMLEEHDQGRRYVGGMADAIEPYARGDAAAAKRITENARGYIGLLSQHIHKEDNILYPMADQVLSNADQRELVEKFEVVERERIGEDKHHHYLELVKTLEGKYLA